MDPNVTAYIDNLDLDWQVEVCNRLRQIIHQAIPEVEERIHYHRPYFLRHGSDVCAMGAAKWWVSVTIFDAATLQAPAGVCVPGDSARKTIRIRRGQPVDDELLTRLLTQVAPT